MSEDKTLGIETTPFEDKIHDEQATPNDEKNSHETKKPGDDSILDKEKKASGKVTGGKNPEEGRTLHKDKQMSQEEYLEQLHKYLRKLPRQDYEDAMDYFTEYFEDADEAATEALMDELGTPKEAAREIIANLLDRKLDQGRRDDSEGDFEVSGVKSRRWFGFDKHIVWTSMLLILAAPIGVPIVVILLILLGCFAICLGCALLCMILLAGCLVLLGGRIALAAFTAISVSGSGFVLLLGCSLLTIGSGILALILMAYLCKWSALLIATLARKIGRRKEAK